MIEFNKLSIPVVPALAGLALSLSLADPIYGQEPAGQLGILDLAANDGLNPATGNPWEIGDTYHLIFITGETTQATSTEISFYNDFVQAEAEKEGWGGVDWFVMGSTATTNALDNAVITGPVINISDQGVLALDATDFWDLDFSSSPARPYTLTGERRNIHSGTLGGGLTQAGNELGAEDETVRIAWSGWENWALAWRAESTTDQKSLAAISQELTIVGGIQSLSLTVTSNGPDFDFTWESQEGMVYDLVSSLDLSTPPADWEVYDDGAQAYEALPASETGLNTLIGVPVPDSKRFFAVVEREIQVGG